MKIYSQSEVIGKVNRIVRVAKIVDSELHNILCSILTHTHDHGDYTAILPLLNGLPNGVRKQAIVAWVSNFSGKQLKVSKSSKDKTWKCELAEGWSKDKFDLEGAYAVGFGDFTVEPEPTTVTLELLIKMLEKKASSTARNADGTPKVTDDARIAASAAVAVMREKMLKAG
jgi:hypothetical protein